ncbi:non-ribosomal peptide synthetase [Saccharothrix sp. NRRL B-16348]|uniref:non-ribosomal peptide synthetase n=1 Tax=Saccharothrix sp. NRRL B-16348 TaxID=1415542 RepID=UPI0018D0EC24|nr:non-ribosomal peptide synthetase [Saccharothrix sp. NRRL B-16348]
MAGLLGTSEDSLDENVDLISEGLDSIRMMKVVGTLRKAGVPVSFAELAERPTLGHWMELVDRHAAAPTAAPQATSATAADDTTPFDLTPVQHAYWVGRREEMALGGVGCHAYFEFDGRLVDPDRLDDAVRKVIARHGMLRARFLSDGRQQITSSADWRGLTVHDLRSTEQVEERLREIRAGLCHRRMDVEHGQVFDVQLALLPGDRTRIHLDVDLLVADVASIQVILRDLAIAYSRPEDLPGSPQYSFADYLRDLAATRAEPRRRAQDHWRARLAEMPTGGPQLPLARDPGQVEAPRFSRRTFTLSRDSWATVKGRAAAAGVTPAMVLATAFAETLAAWSAQRRFLLNVPLFDRQHLHDDVPEMVADFTNLLLLEADMTAVAPFADRVRALQGRFRADVAFAEYSAVEVLRDMSRGLDGEQVAAPVVFASNIGGEFVGPEFTDVLGRFEWMLSQTPQVWLDHQLYEIDGDLLLAWDVVDELFPPGLVDDMFDAYRGLLHWLADFGTDWSSPVPMLVPQRQLAARAAVNSTAAPIPDSLLHEPFVTVARAEPDRVALILADGEQVSYGDLLHRAGAVAHAVRAAGTTPGDLVAVVLEKGWPQIAAVLGTLMAGCAYVPVDGNQPAVRRDQMLNDAGVAVVLTDSAGESGAWPAGLRAIAVDALTPAEPPVGDAASPDDLAYVIFTSGSTGRPKGVMISHRAARNTIEDIDRRFAIGRHDRVLGLANLGFDLSVYDIFGTLALGGTLVLPSPARRGDPSHWAHLVATAGVTVWNSVPAQLQMLNDFIEGPAPELASLRLAMLSGDWIPVGLPDEIRAKIPGLTLISLGGATEAAIWSIYYPIDHVPTEWTSIPYGKPLANQSFYVLDDAMRPVPDLVAGELYIGGAGVALGYLGDEAKTAERFVRHPETGERLYRTGDLGRYLPDGNIEFLGRTDFQVKVRGHRIELAEIEAALQSVPGVASAAVIVDGDRNDRRLVGFVSAARRAPLPESSDGRAELTEVVQDATSGIEDETARIDVARFRRHLDRAQLLAMAHALRGHGLFPDPGTVHTVEEVLDGAKVAPQHHRLVRRWLRVLGEEGVLLAADGHYRMPQPVTAEAVDDAWRQADEARPALVVPDDLMWYLKVSIDHLPDLMHGDVEQVQLFFPEGRLDYAKAMYEETAIARYLNQATVAAIAELARNHSEPRPFRILEVGAGTAGTSRDLIPLLDGLDVEYVFTDVTAFFLTDARARFGHFPWMEFGTYDINEDFRSQGLAANSFDVVLCAHILHNAQDISRTMRQLRELTRPGGAVAVLEMTHEHHEMMTCMEFMVRSDGDFDDRRRGRDELFLARSGWMEEIEAADGRCEAIFPPDGSPMRSFGQDFFLIRVKEDRVDLDADEVLDALAERLPEHMIPSELQIVDSLPLSDNGKVDRKRLAAWTIRVDAAADSVRAEPREGTERQLAEVWAEGLGKAAVSRDRTLAELGGDSLLTVRIVRRTRELVPAAAGVEFRDLLGRMLRQPTIADLAAWLEARS